MAIGPVTEVDPGALGTPDALLVAAQVFEPLVAQDPETGELRPSAADRWEVLDGGRRFLFHLGEGRFHDGTPVTAADFVRAWRRLANPTPPRPYAFLLRPVQGFSQHRLSLGARPFDGVRAVDPGTLEIRLREPWPDFPAVLGHPALAPIPEAAGRAGWRVRPIGNGPYRVAEDLALGRPIRLVAAEEVGAGVDAVEFRQVDGAEAAWPDFLRGELDVAPIPSALVDQARAEFGERGIRTLPRLVTCGFNLEGDFPQELRTAVSVALDRRALVDAAYGALAEPADGIVPPTLPGYRPGACGADCEHDPERAARLLDEVPSHMRAFTIDFARSAAGRRLAEAMAEQLRAVGLRPRPRARDREAYARLLRERRHGMFCLVWTADYPRAQAMLEPLLRSDSGDNHAGLDDARMDRLLERGRVEEDPAEREEHYVDAERRALRHMPLVPLAWLRSGLAVQPYLEGFEVDALGVFDAARVGIGPG